MGKRWAKGMDPADIELREIFAVERQQLFDRMYGRYIPERNKLRKTWETTEFEFHRLLQKTSLLKIKRRHCDYQLKINNIAKHGEDFLAKISRLIQESLHIDSEMHQSPDELPQKLTDAAEYIDLIKDANSLLKQSLPFDKEEKIQYCDKELNQSALKFTASVEKVSQKLTPSLGADVRAVAQMFLGAVIALATLFCVTTVFTQGHRLFGRNRIAGKIEAFNHSLSEGKVALAVARQH